MSVRQELICQLDIIIYDVSMYLAKFLTYFPINSELDQYYIRKGADIYNNSSSWLNAGLHGMEKSFEISNLQI